MKKILITLVCLALLVPALSAFGIEILEEKKIDVDRDGKIIAITQLLCVDGKKFVQTVAAGTGSDVGVAIVQIYDVRAGTMMPVKCGGN